MAATFFILVLLLFSQFHETSQASNKDKMRSLVQNRNQWRFIRKYALILIFNEITDSPASTENPNSPLHALNLHNIDSQSNHIINLQRSKHKILDPQHITDSFSTLDDGTEYCLVYKLFPEQIIKFHLIES